MVPEISFGHPLFLKEILEFLLKNPMIFKLSKCNYFYGRFFEINLFVLNKRLKDYFLTNNKQKPVKVDHSYKLVDLKILKPSLIMNTIFIYLFFLFQLFFFFTPFYITNLDNKQKKALKPSK